jgi:hypothetical protein
MARAKRKARPTADVVELKQRRAKLKAVQLPPEPEPEVVAVPEPLPPSGTVRVRWTKLGAKRKAWLNGRTPAAGEVLETDAATAEQSVARGFAEPA